MFIFIKSTTCSELMWNTFQLEALLTIHISYSQHDSQQDYSTYERSSPRLKFLSYNCYAYLSLQNHWIHKRGCRQRVARLSIKSRNGHCPQNIFCVFCFKWHRPQKQNMFKQCKAYKLIFDILTEGISADSLRARYHKLVSVSFIMKKKKERNWRVKIWKPVQLSLFLICTLGTGSPLVVFWVKSILKRNGQKMFQQQQ